jgi:hypothetical protein
MEEKNEEKKEETKKCSNCGEESKEGHRCPNSLGVNVNDGARIKDGLK